MEQQQSQVSFSIGTKLLLSVASLLLIAILFLNFSTIVLLIEDKRAYTYQTQSTEAILAGREFIGKAQSAVDTLRVSLATVDPRRPVTAQTTNQLEAVLSNQTDLIGISVEFLKPDTAQLSRLSSVFKAKVRAVEGTSKEDFAIPPQQLGQFIPELLQTGYVFVNLTRLGGQPILAAIIADLELRTHPSGVPVAIGYMSLSGFARELSGSDLAIAMRNGAVLFATDPELFLSVRSVADQPLFRSALASNLASGTMEFEHESQRYLGSYFKPGFDVVVLTRTEWRKAMRSAYALTERFILLGCMALGAAVIFAILFAKRLTAPINRLYEATKQVGSGNFNLSLEVPNQSDEIGALTSSFNHMSREISELIRHKVESVQLENEVQIASTVQQTLMPPTAYQDEYVQVISHYQSATQCGGDWWGFFGVGKKMCFMMADATGHGLPSALITASARSCFSVMHKLSEETPEFAFSPGSMLAYANRVVHDAALGKIMMTFFMGVADFEEKTLTFASAGHNPPWLFKKTDGKYVLKSLTASGQRLGEARDVPPYEERTVSLDLEDVLFMYTDGIMEGKNLEGQMFGKKRVRKIVESCLERGPAEVVTRLKDDFLAYNEGKQLDDDITLAAVKLLRFAQPAGNA